ncbi:hypothetical protein WQ57_25040 [Mesobacillus campisalis]|uniref:YqgU-like 6-bladed beta-propeller domain-containing protein n=1 Tax=Mesobacillus campisalis TaxID=1408103 RepID=A0A0M2SFZ1_9BACI|nr:hypothetical protein [Mesobacillus campisalis]KKK33198.1 hypothetical protein WQ57_25040 [Mesobacillus campisalis]
MGRRVGNAVSKGKFLLFFAFLFLAGISLAGCFKEDSASLHEKASHVPNKKDGPAPGFSGKAPVLPLNVEGDFFKAIGWLDERTILYITNVSEGSNLYRYDIYDGKSTLLYESPHFAVTAELSPGKKHVLIHSAPSSYEAELAFINPNGEMLFKTRFPSFELAFEWNGEDEEKVLVSAFREDWSYQVYILDIGNENITEVDLDPPFAIWPAEEEMYYLDWDNTGPALHAPLKKRILNTQAEHTILEGVHHLEGSGELVLAVQTSETDNGMAAYQFIDSKSGERKSFEVVQLSAFSGWLVPFYDLGTDNSFVYFRPLYSGEADLYGAGFTLSRYSLDEGSEENLMEGMENEPINCAPDGKYCLYGFQLEKLIDMEKKQIINLIDNE